MITYFNGKINIGDISMLHFRRIKNIREDYDITQKEMANILNVNRSTYSLWELSVNIIPLPNLYDYANYFNISIDYLLGLTNDKKSGRYYKGLNLKRLGNNIRKIRLKNQLSQEDVAEILGVSQACISKIEKGLICISTINLYKFCKEFNISLDNILGQEKSSKLTTKVIKEKDIYLETTR